MTCLLGRRLRPGDCRMDAVVVTLVLHALEVFLTGLTPVGPSDRDELGRPQTSIVGVTLRRFTIRQAAELTRDLDHERSQGRQADTDDSTGYLNNTPCAGRGKCPFEWLADEAGIVCNGRLFIGRPSLTRRVVRMELHESREAVYTGEQNASVARKRLRTARPNNSSIVRLTSYLATK